MQFRVYNKTLDKNLWNEKKELDPKIHALLLKIVKDYYEGNDTLSGSLVDAYIVGSSANYNWTPDSDLDLHLIVDSSNLDIDPEMARTLFELMSHKWNQNHEIKVKGHNVEIYIQDINHKIRSSGIYSLTDGKWVKEPHPEKVEIDREHIKKKFRNMVERIEKAIESTDIAKMKKVMEDIRQQRNTGLDKSGEFSSENLVFKMLRKFGYIKKLKEATHKIYDKEMTLTEKLEDPHNLIIGYVTPSLKVKAKTRAEISSHGEFTEIKNWTAVNSWRFRKDLNILFWWKPYQNKISQDERDAVLEFLENKFGARNITQKMIIPSPNNTSSWDVSHGIEEMAQMSLKGKVAYANNIPLKGMKLEKVEDNVVIFRQPDPGEFIPEGFTLLYFLDSEENAKLMRDGKIPYLMVPRGTFHSGGSPITDIWKKKFQQPGTEHIIGHIEANTSPDGIFVDMITVRPGWKRNHIATLMMAALRKMYPEAKLTYSSTTDQGEKFFNNLHEDTGDWWISGITTEKLETVSEKYSGNINNVTHRHLSFKYHFPGRVIFWRYTHNGNFLNFMGTPTDDEKQEVYDHLKQKYGVTPQHHQIYGLYEIPPDQKRGY